jgi:hypothetical protein
VPVSATEVSSSTDRVGPDGVEHLLVDDQVRLGPGPCTAFHRRVYRVLTEKAIRDVSEFQAQFEPTYETVVLHGVTLRRNGSELSRLDEAALHVLQRAPELEEHVYDQSTSVVLFLDDVRVGDVIETSYSVVGENPVFAGRYAAHIPLGWSMPVAKSFARIVVPNERTIHILPHAGAAEPVVAERDGARDFRWERRDTPAVVAEPALPQGFDPYPACDVSEFTDWADVARWGVGLFTYPEPSSSELLAKVDELARSHATPAERIEAAVALVRDEVRYLGLEFGPNSHRPAPPDQVWQRRFGDCKDKALLLVTLLRRSGIQACPALVHSESIAEPERALPSPLEFNHVIVQLRLESHTHWIDPTLLHARGTLDRRACPRYGFALVLDDSTRALTPIVPRPDDLPNTRIETRIVATKMDDDAQVTIETTDFGANADRMRAQIAELGIPAVDKRFLNYYARSYPSIRSLALMSVRDDPQNDEITTTERYAVPHFWKRSPDGGRTSATFEAREIADLVAAPSTSVRTMPLAVPFPLRVVSHVEATLPGTWKLAPEHRSLETAAFRFAFETQFSGSIMQLTYSYSTLADRVPPEDMRAHAEHLGVARDTTSYKLSRNTPGTASDTRAKSLATANRGVLGFAVLACLIAFGASLALYRYRPKRPPVTVSNADAELQGNRVCLLFGAIGICLTPLYMFPKAYRLLLSVAGPGWDVLTNPSSKTYDSLWAPLLLGELLANICMCALSALLVLLLVEKRRTLPMTFALVRGGWCVVVVADHIATRLVSGIGDQPGPGAAISTILFTIPWVIYFLRSRRVLVTFVN